MSTKTGSIFNLKVGDLVRNNDPRYGWITPIERIVNTAGFDFAILKPEGAYRVCKVRLDRIFVDANKHAQGYSLVSAPEAELSAIAGLPPLPEGVQMVSMDDMGKLHNTIAAAVGEGTRDYIPGSLVGVNGTVNEYDAG